MYRYLIIPPVKRLLNCSNHNFVMVVGCVGWCRLDRKLFSFDSYIRGFLVLAYTCLHYLFLILSIKFCFEV